MLRPLECLVVVVQVIATLAAPEVNYRIIESELASTIQCFLQYVSDVITTGLDE